MIVLGLDPSLTNFGWAVHDTEATGADRCIARGRFQTSTAMVFVDRYMELRDRLAVLIQEVKPDRMGQEFPVFGDLASSQMYGVYLYSCEAIRQEKQDVVFWSPMSVKAVARDFLDRPLIDGKKWKMHKGDMVDAAKKDTGGKGRWSSDEADAYWVARLSGRFWLLLEGSLSEADLTPTERSYFMKVHTFQRGKKAGRTVKPGALYREDDRFFRWSEGD